jgi:hypothetical protein
MAVYGEFGAVCRIETSRRGPVVAGNELAQNPRKSM